MTSANEIEGDKRVRLSKKKFKEIQQRLENYKNQKHKELRESSFYQDKKDLSKTKQNEQELKNRGAKSIRDIVKENLEKLLIEALQKNLYTIIYIHLIINYTQGVILRG